MGNRASRSQQRAPRRSLHTGHLSGGPVSHLPSDVPVLTVLSENDAWAIAVKWREQLQGCVRLETDPLYDTAGGMVPIFEWVSFTFNGSPYDGFRSVDDHQKAAACARAQTIAWFALSCCDGFSGTQNPRFWRRVFRELAYLPHTSAPTPAVFPERAQRPITDAVRFFDRGGNGDHDRSFPRILFVSSNMDDTYSIERIFLGLAALDDPVRDRNLQTALTMLKPWICSSLWTQRSRNGIPLCVDAVHASAIKAFLLHTMSRVSNPSTGPKPALVMGVQTPRFHLQSTMVVLPTYTSVHRIPGLMAVLNNEDEKASEIQVRVIFKSLELKQLIGGSSNDPICLSTVLPDKQQQRSNCRILSLRQCESRQHTASDIAKLCSVLPRHWGIQDVLLLEPHWEWIGYAVFHPDAASCSSLTSLSVSLRPLSNTQLDAFKSMAVGHVDAGTTLWTQPHTDAAHLICSLPHTTTVGLCVRSLDELDTHGWIQAVVPGIGLAWLQSSTVVGAQSRKAGKSCLRSLHVYAYQLVDSLIQLLLVIGDQLTTLHLTTDELLDTGTLQRVLRQCPNLKRLCVCHSGAMWADVNLAMEMPKLEELELRIGTVASGSVRLAPLAQACLPHLVALRVQRLGQPDPIVHHAETSLLPFLERNRSVQHVHWSSRDLVRSSWIGISYEDLYKATHVFRRALVRGVHDVFDTPLSVDSKLAFLSVVVHHQRVSDMITGGSSLSRVGQDVLTIIFQFATSAIQRTFFISP